MLLVEEFDPTLVARWFQKTDHLRNRPSAVSNTTFIPHWENLMRWMKSLHDGDIGIPPFVMSRGSRTQPYQEAIIFSMYKMTRILSHMPWHLMEIVLGETRSALAAIDSRWGDDY